MTHDHRSLSTRSFIFFVILCIAYSAITLNLYRIQIYDNNFFTNLGAQQYNVTVTKLLPRAPIFDRNNCPLAINHDCISAFMVPNKIHDLEKLKDFLTHHFPQCLPTLEAKSQKSFMYLHRKLSSEQIALIQEAGLPDIQLVHESSRFYPISCMSTIVGKTDIDNHGILGIELHYNDLLAGSPSSASLQKDARSGHFYFKKETTNPGKEGSPLYLSIDGTLQFLVQEEIKARVIEFGAEHGSAVIMDPKTGEILTMATWPSFDSNNPSLDSLDNTKNRVISDAYELGSVIKVFAALAALEKQVVTPDELINCRNSKTAIIDGRTINTWHEHSIIPFADVIALSNNIGIAIVAKRVGEDLYNYYTKLGFGMKTAIQLPGEHKGFVNHPSRWSKQSIISLSYGYEITATLLQLACAFCAIARNGYRVIPTILRADSSDTIQQNTSAPRLFSEHHSMLMKQILERTTQQGTTRRAQIKGYRVMSKSGTANQLIDGVYDTTKHRYTCAGIVEKDDYQRVIIAFLKDARSNNLYASTVVAPLFEKIAQKMLIHDRII